jgi:hypothetical protein
MKPIQYTETIEKYINGELRGEELSSFEKEIKQSKELAEDVKLHTAIEKFLRNKELFEFREMLDEIHEEVVGDTDKIKKRQSILRLIYTRWQYAAAVLIILLSISAVLYYTLRPSLNERLYTQYFESYNKTVFYRTINETSANEMKLALSEYSNKNYEKSWGMLKEISDKDKTDAAFFFRGMSAMETNKLDDAILSLSTVMSNDSSLYVDQATWYIGLCFLKKDDKENAQVYFKKVVENNYNHKEEAEEIMEKIK